MPVTPWLSTGSQKAAPRSPTTAALTAVNAVRRRGEWRQRPQKCSPATMSRAEGRKMATVASRAPAQPPSTAPMKEAKVNSGPGTAWAAE